LIVHKSFYGFSSIYLAFILFVRNPNRTYLYVERTKRL